MNKQRVARELVMVARDLMMAKKGEVPEAFKKEWKNKDKDNDGKENEPKPDFLKKKDKKSSIAQELVAVAKELTAAPHLKSTPRKLDQMAKVMNLVSEISKEVVFYEGDQLTKDESTILISIGKRSRNWARFARALKRRLG